MGNLRSWSSTLASVPTPSIPESQFSAPSGVTIAAAAQSYLMKSQHRGVEPSTLSKYKTFTNQLCDYAESRGYVMSIS